MRKLTEKQKDILDFISDFTKENRMSPSVSEIAQHFELKTSTIFAHLKALQKKNRITRSSKARSIFLTRNNAHKLKNLKGASVFHQQEHSENCFTMTLDKDCYLSCGILPGDIAILQKNPEPIHQGDLLLTLSGDDQIILECKNISGETAEFLDLHKQKHVTYPLKGIPPIQGKVIGIQRMFH